MDKTRADFIREKVEELKAFDIVHELRTINTEASMGVPDVVPIDAVVEKLKPGFDAIAAALEGLLVAVEDLESKTTGDYIVKQIADYNERGREPRVVKTYEGEILQVLT